MKSNVKFLVTTIVTSCFLSVASAAIPSWGHTGTPKKITCVAMAKVAEKPITAKTDINVLLEKSTTVQLGDVNPTCAKYAGDTSGTCEAILNTGKLYMRYFNNSQNGGISIDDNVTGQSSEQSWYNQYELTKSGYLTTSVALTNTSGGIAGDASIFRVDFRCQARITDW